jgi:hypothetical protein
LWMRTSAAFIVVFLGRPREQYSLGISSIGTAVWT